MDNLMEEEGYLELFIGPMWSGKTSELIRIHKQFSYCDVLILAINYKLDTRYSETTISSHDNKEIPCVRTIHLSDVSDIVNNEITSEFINAKVILINEGQFFKDIVSWVKVAVEKYNKKVYICGLDGDYTRKQFGNWLGELIPFCNKVTKLNSICASCKNKPAIFTHRSSDEIQQEFIGNNYLPLCRNCYKRY